MKRFTKKPLKGRLNKMRIAYVSLHWPRPAASSIGKKIIMQSAAWRAAGNEVKFFSHMHSLPDLNGLLDGTHQIYEVKKGLLGGLKTEMNRIVAAARLIQRVAEWQPDIIYMRWAMYVFPIQRLFRIAPVVVEINTNDVNEHRLLGVFYGLYNQLTRGIILGRASGHIFANSGLMNTPEFDRFHKQSIVLTNGIDLKSTPAYPAPNNTPPHLIFIGTPGMAWHGLDKLVELARTFPDIIIDIVGMSEIEGISDLPGNLVMHGYLSGAAYEAMLASADAAIGTLSLHVKGMDEVAPLKIRDCSARGIPCILPYRDIDFEGLDSQLFLQIPNRVDSIKTHGQAVHDFVMQASGKRVPRELIAGRIDSSIKEKQRLDFFQKIIKNQF